MRCRVLKAASACILLSLWATGYAAETFPDFPVRPAQEYKLSAEQDGVTLGLQPVEDINAQKTYFHTELTSKGFVPVFLVIHNGSAKESVLFDTSKVSCKLGSSGGAEPKTPTKAANTATALELAAIPWGGVVAAPVVAEMYAHASHIQQNLMLKEIQSQTLSPGESAYGFLYVPIPKKSGRQKIQIHIPVTWAGSGKESVLSVTF